MMDLLQFILCLFMIINAIYNVYQGAPAVQEDKQSKDEKLSQGSSEVNDAQEGCETLPLELIPRREEVASSNPCSTSHRDTHDRKQARGTSVKAGTRHRHTKPSPPEPHNPIVPLHKDIESHRPQGTARRLYASDPPPSYSFFVEPKPPVKPPVKPPKVKLPSFRNRVPQPPYPPHPMIIGRASRPLQSSTNPRPAPPASDPKSSAPIPHTSMTMPPIPLPKSSDARNTLKQTSLDNHLGRQQQVADTVQHATRQSHPETKPQAPSDTEEKKHEQDKNVSLKDTTTTTPLQKTLVNGSTGPLDRRNGTTPQSQPQPQPQPKAQLNVEGTGQVKHETVDIRQMLSSSIGPTDIRNETTPQAQPQLKAHLNVKGTGQTKHENIGIRQIPAQETSVDDRKTQPLPQPNVEETKQEPKYRTVTNALPVVAVQPKPHSVPEPQQPQPQSPCPPTVHPLNVCTVGRLPLSYYDDYPMEDAQTYVASNTSHQHEPQHIPMDVWVDEVIEPVAVVSFEMSIFSAEEKVAPASAPSYTYASCRWAWYTLRDVDEEMPYAHAGAEDTQLPVLPEATPMEIDPWSISSILPQHDHCNASNTPPAGEEPAPKSAFAPIDISSSNTLDTTQPRYIPWTPPLVTGSSPGFVPTKPSFGRASFREPSPPRQPQVLDVPHRLEVSQHAEVSQLDVPQAATDVPDSTSESLPHKLEHPQHSPELSQLEVPQPEVVDVPHELDHVQEPIFQPTLEVSQLEVSQQPTTDVPQELDAHQHGSWQHTLEPVPQPTSEVLQQIVGVPDWNLDILPAQAPEIPQDVLDVPQIQVQDALQPAPEAQYYALQSEPQQSAVGVQYAEISNSVPATVPTKTTGLSLLDLCEAAKRAAAKDVKAKIKKEMDVLKELDVTHKCINIICVTAAKDSIDLIKSAQEKFCEDYHDHSLVSLDFDQISRISVWVRKIDLYEKTAHLAENTQHPPSTNLTTAPEASTSLESDHALHPTSVASNSDGGRPHYPASTSFEAGPSTSTSPESPPQRYTAAQKGKGKAIPTDNQDTTNYWASPTVFNDRTTDKSPLTTFSKLERFKDLKNPEVLTVWGTRKKQTSPKSRLESEQVVNDFMCESIAQNDHSRGEEYWKALDEKTGFTDASFDSEVTCGGQQEFQPADYCDVQHESSLSYVPPTSPNENIPRTIKPLPRRRLTSTPQHANSTEMVNDDRSPQVINPLPAWVGQSAAAAPTIVEFVNYGPETDFDSL